MEPATALRVQAPLLKLPLPLLLKAAVPPGVLAPLPEVVRHGRRAGSRIIDQHRARRAGDSRASAARRDREHDAVARVGHGQEVADAAEGDAEGRAVRGVGEGPAERGRLDDVNC